MNDTLKIKRLKFKRSYIRRALGNPNLYNLSELDQGRLEKEFKEVQNELFLLEQRLEAIPDKNKYLGSH
ncbi:MAG: hypothetical protein ACFFG0_43935 [Candidatus Thorarchaeota archaeon]